MLLSSTFLKRLYGLCYRVKRSGRLAIGQEKNPEFEGVHDSVHVQLFS